MPSERSYDSALSPHDWYDGSVAIPADDSATTSESWARLGRHPGAAIVPDDGVSTARESGSEVRRSYEARQEQYASYQSRYVDEPRQSDQVIISMVERLTQESGGTSVLDIGCSTGNLLRHMRRALPDIALNGADLIDHHLDLCRADPDLAGMPFMHLDVLGEPLGKTFDVVICNALNNHFDEDAYRVSANNVAAMTSEGGHYIGFEWIHPFEVDYQIIEKSHHRDIDDTLYFRSQASVINVLKDAGFTSIAFFPFELTVDLPVKGWQSLDTYTVDVAGGRKLSFRSALSQPWCHFIAAK